MSVHNNFGSQLQWNSSPLAASLDRMRVQLGYGTIVSGRPAAGDADWVTAAEFTQPAIADRPIERVMHKYDATRPVAGTYTFRAFLALPLELAGYLFAVERRVPVLDQNLLYNNRESLYHIALLEPRAIVLAGDELVGQPGIETVANETALQDALFQQVASLLEPVVAAWAPRKLVNRRNAWASALDYLAYGFQMAGKHTLGLDAAWAQFNQVCTQDIPARRRPQRFQYEVDGEADEMVVRAGCCLWYMLPSMRTAENHYCTSCYLETDEKRLQILTDYKRRQTAAANA